jgi:hypothetical protein
LIHLIRNKVKPVNLNAAIAHVEKIKKKPEFSTITELLVFNENNKIMEHAEEYDLPVVYIVTLKQSRNLPN